MANQAVCEFIRLQVSAKKNLTAEIHLVMQVHPWYAHSMYRDTTTRLSNLSPEDMGERGEKLRTLHNYRLENEVQILTTVSSSRTISSISVS